MKIKNGIAISAVVLVLVGMLLIFTGLFPGNGGDGAAGGGLSGRNDGSEMTYEEIGAALERVGIGGITDELLDEMETEWQSMPTEYRSAVNKAAQLLIELGKNPAESGVYSFKLNTAASEGMYTEFLDGVAAMGRGNLDFTHITETRSNVAGDSGGKTATAVFNWNGETWAVEADVTGTFDTGFTASLNKIITDDQYQTQLYFLTDGFQDAMVFYGDPAWAADFAKATGCRLSKKLA